MIQNSDIEVEENNKIEEVKEDDKIVLCGIVRDELQRICYTIKLTFTIGESAITLCLLALCSFF